MIRDFKPQPLMHEPSRLEWWAMLVFLLVALGAWFFIALSLDELYELLP
jgi:hypothetical protein